MKSDKCSDKSSFCERLNLFLMDRFDYKTPPASWSTISVTVDARRKKFDLYFRFFEEEDYERFWGGKAIVISRIGFQRTRRGHGDSLLKFIVEFAQENNYEAIGIEQANTAAIKNFAKKYGFSRIGTTNNYTIPVDQLSISYGVIGKV